MVLLCTQAAANVHSCVQLSVACGAVADGVAAACRLPWGDAPAAAADDESTPVAGCADVVIAADCLFFEGYHEALLRTCATLLLDGGGSLALVSTASPPVAAVKQV
jgi:hypothetical protein